MRSPFKLSTIAAVLPLLLSCTADIDSGDTVTKDPEGFGLVPGAPSAVASKVGDVIDTLIESPHDLGPNMTYTDQIFEPGATFIKVHFGLLELKAGDEVLVSDEAGNVVDRIYYDGGTDDVWAVRVTGDTALITINTSSVPGIRAGFAVDRFSKGTVDLASTTAPSDPTDPSNWSTWSICGSDDKKAAACFDGSIALASQAVGQMTFTKNGSSFVCTGSLISSTGLFITNNHCVASQADVNTLETTFNYQNSACSGTSLAPTTVVKGGTFLKTSQPLDYTLIQLPNNPAATFGFLQIDTAAATVGQEIYIPQHPGGRRKEIATTENGANCKIKEINADRGGYASRANLGYTCDTEGGSSGSPVLSRANNKIVALHHLGGCNNSGTHITKILPEIEGFLGQVPPPNPPPAPTPGQGTFDQTATPNRAIPDNNTAGITSTLTVPSGVIAAKVLVDVDIKHTYRGDLVVKLVAPNGQSAIVSNKAGGSADNLIGSFDVTTQFSAGLSAAGTWTLSVVDAASADLGTLTSWRLQINPGLQQPSNTFIGHNNNAKTIPDNNTTGITSTIVASNVSSITSVQVELSITHTWRGDLVVDLTSPSGATKSVVARANSNDSTDNITAKFDVAGFTGSGNGTWTLTVKDLAAQDLGTLNYWKLGIGTALP